MVIFHSYVTNYQRVYPIEFHETTIFLWFSYGFPMITYDTPDLIAHIAGQDPGPRRAQ